MIKDYGRDYRIASEKTRIQIVQWAEWGIPEVYYKVIESDSDGIPINSTSPISLERAKSYLEEFKSEYPDAETVDLTPELERSFIESEKVYKDYAQNKELQEEHKKLSPLQRMKARRDFLLSKTI